MEKETRTVHPEPTVLPEGNRPLTSPIYQSVKFAPPSFEAMSSGKFFFFYSRVANPTVKELETLLAELQGTEDGIGVASGVAAISTTLLALLKQGDEVLCFLESYKPSRVLLREMERFGVKHHFVSVSDWAKIEALLKSKKIRLLLVESPTNPILRIPDFERLLKLCQENSVITVLDNTFAGFHNHGQYPFDLFLHSLTKFAGGHGDVMGFTAQAFVARSCFVIRQNRDDGVWCVAAIFGPLRDGLAVKAELFTDLLTGLELRHWVCFLWFVCANWRLHLFDCVDVLNHRKENFPLQ